MMSLRVRIKGKPRAAGAILLVAAVLIIGSRTAAPFDAPMSLVRRSTDGFTKIAETVSPHFQGYDNSALTGDDIRTETDATLQTCIAACQPEIGCRAFSFDKWQKKCSLKESAGSLRFDPRSISGLAEGSARPPDAAGPISTEEVHGTALSGTSLRSQKASVFADCELVCRNDGDCVAFTYSSNTGACNLFSSVDSYDSDKAADSGLKEQLPQQTTAPDQGGSQVVELTYSPWTKFCLPNRDASSKQACFIGKDARLLESGKVVVAAVLIESENDAKKILRVTVPPGAQLVHGTRVVIDRNAPITAPYVTCLGNGCMADYQASPQMIEQMKQGQGLYVQWVGAAGRPLTVALPLADFAKAYDGPPTDPKVFQAQQEKLRQELKARGEEARRRLEQIQPAASPASPGKAQ